MEAMFEMRAMIEMQGVDTAYDGVPMLRGVDLVVREGELVCLLGANGAGKTTTFRTLIGLVRPTAGSVRVMDHDVTRLGTQRIARLGVGLVPEARRLFPDLTVRENLFIGHRATGRGEGFEPALAEIGTLFPRIIERLSQPARTLSGGEQAMVALGRALIGDPELLIMDEPSLGLSPKLVHEYFATIERIHRAGKTLLLVEQNAEMGLATADRGYVLAKGRVVALGTAAELHARDVARHAYSGNKTYRPIVGLAISDRVPRHGCRSSPAPSARGRPRSARRQ
jgi:branched-chain amino acid transport system ATP-binding protein